MQVREAALSELAERRAERDIKESELEMLNQEILRLEQAVASLSPLASDGVSVMHVGIVVEGVAEMNLADAIRAILKHNPTYRTARGIRDSLRDSGYNLDQHPNHLAGIHGVLKRLVESGEVEQLESDGKTRYRWKGEFVSAVFGPPEQVPTVSAVDKFLSQIMPPQRRRKSSFQELAEDLTKKK